MHSPFVQLLGLWAHSNLQWWFNLSLRGPQLWPGSIVICEGKICQWNTYGKNRYFLGLLFQLSESDGPVFGVSNRHSLSWASRAEIVRQCWAARGWQGHGWEVTSLRTCPSLCPASRSLCQAWSVSPELRRTWYCWSMDRGASAGQILKPWGASSLVSWKSLRSAPKEYRSVGLAI